MAMALNETTRKLRLDLRRTWLIWSCVPLVAVLIGLAATTAVYASQPVLSQKRAEDSFYMFLAISALVFLFAFSADGHWTNPKRVGERIRQRLASGTDQKAPIEAAAAAAEARAAVAADIILGSSSSLGLMGHAIGAIAILCLVSGAGLVHAYLILAVAVSYQLYLFSRHPYYEQIAQAAYADELEAEEEQAKRGDRRK